jgi:hypothetical protein
MPTYSITTGLVITNDTTLSASVGAAYTIQLTANSTAVTWDIVSGANFTIEGDTLTMIDTSTAGDSAVTVSASDGAGQVIEATITVTLTGSPPGGGFGTPTGLAFASATPTTITMSFNAVTGAVSYDAAIDGDTGKPRTLGVAKTVGVARPGNEYMVQVRAYNGTSYSAWSSQVAMSAAELADPGPTPVTQAIRAKAVTDAHVIQLNTNYNTSTMPFWYYGNATGTLKDGTFVAGGWVKDHIEPLVNVGLTTYRTLPAGHQSATHLGSILARNLYSTYGLKMHATLNYNTWESPSVTDVLTNIRTASKGNFASAIASFAGLNEPNGSSHTYPVGWNWKDETIAHTLAMHTGMSHSAYSGIPMDCYSPWGRRGMEELLAYTDAQGRTWAANCAPLIDRLNLHYYTGGRRPEIAGAPTGADEGGTPLDEVSLDYTMDDYAQLTPEGVVLPYVCTESGWGRLNVSTANPYVSINTSRKYQQRLTFENLRRNIPITVWFQFFQTDTTMDWQMVDYSIAGGTCTFTRNTLYTIFLNDLTAFYDSGATAATFTPGTLAFTLGDGTGSPGAYDQRIHHLLTQKSDGKFYLAVWYEKDSYNRNTKTETFGFRSIKLTLPGAMAVATNRPYTNTTFTSQGTVSSLDFTVHDDVTVFRIG